MPLETNEMAEAYDAERRKEAEQFESEVRSAVEEWKREHRDEVVKKLEKEAEVKIRLKLWKDKAKTDSVAVAMAIKHNGGAFAIADKDDLIKRHRVNPLWNEVAKGANSSIYTAELETGVKVAVKLMGREDMTAFMKKNYESSVKIMRYLIDHPHPSIVAIRDLYESKDSLYIFMELLPSLTVGEHLKSNGPVDEVKVKAWASCIGEAIKYLHTNGITHLNVRPQNVIIVNDTTAKLSDLSYARPYVDADTGEVALCKMLHRFCSPHFPPEAKKRDYDPTKADVWAFGMLVFEMLTKRYPFLDTSRALAEMQWKTQLVESDVQVSDQVRELLSLCLVHDPDARSTIFEVMELDWFKHQ